MFTAQLQQWIRENVGDAAIDVDVHGRRIVDHADDVIRVHAGWLVDHGLGDIVQPDGGLVLDTAGRSRYRPVRGDLPGGFSVYERV
jgi:hypothetical protein